MDPYFRILYKSARLFIFKCDILYRLLFVKKKSMKNNNRIKLGNAEIEFFT